MTLKINLNNKFLRLFKMYLAIPLILGCRDTKDNSEISEASKMPIQILRKLYSDSQNKEVCLAQNTNLNLTNPSISHCKNCFFPQMPLELTKFQRELFFKIANTRLTIRIPQKKIKSKISPIKRLNILNSNIVNCTYCKEKIELKIDDIAREYCFNNSYGPLVWLFCTNCNFVNPILLIYDSNVLSNSLELDRNDLEVLKYILERDEVVRVNDIGIYFCFWCEKYSFINQKKMYI